MRVTPRLPVHGVYLKSAYVEMRYFRYGDYSLPSALLFSLAETCSLPQFSALKQKVEAEMHQCGAEGKKLMARSMNKDSKTNQILTDWNRQTSAVENLAQVFCLRYRDWTETGEMWEEKFGLQIIMHGNEGMEKTGLDAIYWGQCPSDGSIVGLYREYALDSFVVLECKHIYLKAVLYRKAREAMQRPRLKLEMAEVRVVCDAQFCTTNLSQAVFDIARKDADMACDVHTDTVSLSRGSLNFCIRCKKNSFEYICRKSCRMCVPCAAISSLTKHDFYCPQCSGRYQYSIMPKIIQARRQICERQKIPERARCSQCKGFKPLAEFDVLKSSRHVCCLCNQCLLTLTVGSYEIFPACVGCKEDFLMPDTDAIKKWQRENRPKSGQHADRVMQDTQQCQLCLEPKTYMDYCTSKHRNDTCCICDKCINTKIRSLAKCPLCSQEICSGYSQSMVCSGCHSYKQSADFRLSMYLQHLCTLCNTCLLSSMRACLACYESFSDKDLEVVYTKSQPGLIQGKYCPCGNLILKGEFRCGVKCFCSACHLVRMLLNRTRACPSCASECIGRLPASVECSRCLRSIFTTGTTKLSVSGICPKGHILCQHCVEVNADQLSCPVCHTVVQGKPASELREAQRKLFLACYCEEPGTKDLVDLTCGHIIHPRCKYEFQYCRVCGSDVLNHYREKPKEVTIWKYAT